MKEYGMTDPAMLAGFSSPDYIKISESIAGMLDYSNPRRIKPSPDEMRIMTNAYGAVVKPEILHGMAVSIKTRYLQKLIADQQALTASVRRVGGGGGGGAPAQPPQNLGSINIVFDDWDKLIEPKPRPEIYAASYANMVNKAVDRALTDYRKTLTGLPRQFLEASALIRSHDALAAMNLPSEEKTSIMKTNVATYSFNRLRSLIPSFGVQGVKNDPLMAYEASKEIANYLSGRSDTAFYIPPSVAQRWGVLTEPTNAADAIFIALAEDAGIHKNANPKYLRDVLYSVRSGRRPAAPAQKQQAVSQKPKTPPAPKQDETQMGPAIVVRVP